MSSQHYGLVWRAADAIKAATITPESEALAKPVTLKDVVARNRALLDNAKWELEYEQKECLKEIKRAQMDAEKYLRTNQRDLARMKAEAASSYKAQVMRIERAKITIMTNSQTISEFGTSATITQAMTSIARTMQLVSSGPMSSEKLKVISVQLERQANAAEVNREVLDEAVRGHGDIASESAESILQSWETDMVARAPGPPSGGAGGGDGERVRAPGLSSIKTE